MSRGRLTTVAGLALVVVVIAGLAGLGLRAIHSLADLTRTERRRTCYEQVLADVNEARLAIVDPNSTTTDKSILAMPRARYVDEMARCYRLDPR